MSLTGLGGGSVASCNWRSWLWSILSSSKAGNAQRSVDPQDSPPSVYSQDSFASVSDLGLSDFQSTESTVRPRTFMQSRDLNLSISSNLQRELILMMEDRTQYATISAQATDENLASTPTRPRNPTPFSKRPNSHLMIDCDYSKSFESLPATSTSTPQRPQPDYSRSSTDYLGVDSTCENASGPPPSLIVHYNKDSPAVDRSITVADSSYSLIDNEDAASMTSPDSKETRSLLDAALPSSQVLLSTLDDLKPGVNVTSPSRSNLLPSISLPKSGSSHAKMDKHRSRSFATLFKQAKAAIPVLQNSKLAKRRNAMNFAIDMPTSPSQATLMAVTDDGMPEEPHPRSAWFPLPSGDDSPDRSQWYDSPMTLSITGSSNAPSTPTTPSLPTPSIADNSILSVSSNNCLTNNCNTAPRLYDQVLRAAGVSPSVAFYAHPNENFLHNQASLIRRNGGETVVPNPVSIVSSQQFSDAPCFTSNMNYPTIQVSATPREFQKISLTNKAIERKIFQEMNGIACEQTCGVTEGIESKVSIPEAKQEKIGRWKKLSTKASRIFKNKSKRKNPQDEKIDHGLKIRLTKSFSRLFIRTPAETPLTVAISDEYNRDRHEYPFPASASAYVPRTHSSRLSLRRPQSQYMLALPDIPSVCVRNSDAMSDSAMNREYFAGYLPHAWITDSIGRKFSRSVPYDIHFSNERRELST
ncbi:hypothetical protein M422DRAFT_784923 [Sphaerobolus stellatus SS14]|uniref:Uncharacterized protein n=1 Tax=Sphaerobolus stellatus (strain SS14) TaxID=990650 RepID=A0A0C9TDU0_SPHS4|nr:hypothetical protein M422DRAFT_784923 [Sphaerobolus stellatus SS14]